ncbi:MAG: replication initiation protein, partial [Pirellulaceae bacterium]
LIGVRGDRLYSELQAITRRLMQRIISIYPIGEDRLIQVAWLGSADYKFEQATVALSFQPHLHPFMLNLKKNYTALNLSDLMGLQSVYSIRIFELLKQYESIGNREISLKDLREYCGIDF